MGKIIDIAENTQHITQEVICVKCYARFIDVRPASTWLKDCECPGCGEIGFLIGTGQPLEGDE